MTTSTALNLVPLAQKIRAIDAAYLDLARAHGAYQDRINCVQHCVADDRTYVILAGTWVFWSSDSFATLHEVPEVNRDSSGALIPAGGQFVDAIVGTMRGTTVLVGRAPVDSAWAGVVWRKEEGAGRFQRVVVASPAWQTSLSGNASAGFFGTGATAMIAIAIYASPAHLYFSLDDGLTFVRQDLAGLFLEHAHQVFLPPGNNLHRTARLWVTGGDDPAGDRSGVVTFDRLDAAGRLAGQQWVFKERPGYRLVGLVGNGKHVFIGNESVAGGMVKALDNQQCFDTGDFEYALGKSRHDYHQFRSMCSTADGWLVASTDSYAFTGDTLRADSGGYLYISRDQGASYMEISIGAKWSTSLAYDGRSFWLTAGFNQPDIGDASRDRLSLWRLPTAAIAQADCLRICTKALIVDSSNFYRMAGYSAHPRASLAPSAHTLRADMSPYRSIVVDAETYTAATLAVEACPYENWHPDETPWTQVATLTLVANTRQRLLLSDDATHNRLFRVRNIGADACEVRQLLLIGRT